MASEWMRGEFGETSNGCVQTTEFIIGFILQTSNTRAPFTMGWYGVVTLNTPSLQLKYMFLVLQSDLTFPLHLV